MTPKQCLLLLFIRDYQIANDGVTPSFAEMRGHLGLKSNSQIHARLRCLQRDGYIERGHNRVRDITVLDRRADP